MKPLADAERRRVVRESAGRRVSMCRPRATGPCGNDGSRRSPRPRGAASSPARLSADRRGCTSGCAAHGRSTARPCAGAQIPAPPRRRSSMRRPRRPRREAPPAASISCSLAGHSSIVHRFQSSGNPCTAMTSSRSNTPFPARLAMNSGSIGEMPPSTRGSPGASAAIASPASRAMLGKARPVRDRARGPNAICCWARSTASPLRSCRHVLPLCRARQGRVDGAEGGRRLGRRHRNTSSSGLASTTNPALRSIAAVQERFGTHQLVSSPA